MSNAEQDNRWVPHAVGGESYRLLDLAHPSFGDRVMDEMRTGVAVYYDRRWEVTDGIAEWLLENRERIEGKRVFVPGAGVGLETLVIGRHCRHLYFNDLSPLSLALCAEQLRENGITEFTALPGRHEALELPPADLMIGSFLVYNRETLRAMLALVGRFSGPVILMNESLPDFRKFLDGLERPFVRLFGTDDAPGILLPAL